MEIPIHLHTHFSTISRRFPFFSTYIFSFLIICLAAGTIAHSQETVTLNVSVTGIENDLQKNVLVYLSLNRERNNQQLTDFFVNRLVKKASNEVKTALQPFGYYQPVIKIDSKKDNATWNVNISVKPGKPTIISNISIEITGPGSTEKDIKNVVENFPLHKGDILLHQMYETSKSNLISQAQAIGYSDAIFSKHEILVDRENQAASIVLQLETGPLYRFGKTTFQADFISHDLLSRIIPYKEGERFSSQNLIKLRQALYNTDYFSDVEVQAGEKDDETQTVPVNVQLVQKNPNKYGLGIGYGTDTGVRGTIEWTNRLLNRYGHQLKVSLQPSERKDYFGGVYTIPIKDPQRDRLSLLGKWEKEIFENTESEQRSVSISYDHIREYGEYSIYFKYLDEDFDSGLDKGHATLLIPGVKTTYRFTDNRLVTDKGFRFTLDLAGADKNVLSDATFLKGSLSSKGIYSFFDSWRVIGRFQLGATAVDNIDSLPPSLRFYAGGDQSVRGYTYKSIGPEDAMGNVLGGRYLVTYSVELENKMTDQWSGAIFIDSGDAFNAVPDLAIKIGAGFGLRWNAPFGQLRLDIANAVSEENGSWRIHFNVGADL